MILITIYGTILRAVILSTPILLALVGLALILRFIALGDGLWFDEIQTLVDYARLPAGQVVTTFDSQNNHFELQRTAFPRPYLTHALDQIRFDANSNPLETGAGSTAIYTFVA